MERLTVFDREFDRYKVNMSGHVIYTEPGIKTQGGIAINGCVSWLMGEAVERLAQYENERFGEQRPESAPGCIRSCPFCGGAAEADSHFSCVYERIYGEVKCKSCGISKRGSKTFDTYDASYCGYDTKEWITNAHAEAKQSAIDEWNRRVF